MKKLWTTSLQSTFSRAADGPAALAQQIKQSLSSSASTGSINNVASDAPTSAGTSAPTPKGGQGPGEKQYLRLPVESARKLRWYDKGDLQAMVKTHLREKRELTAAIAALKMMLIRSGMSEAELDVETKHILMSAKDIEESDEGVNSVLLVAAQAELETLQVSQVALSSEIEELKQRLQDLEDWGPAPAAASANSQAKAGHASLDPAVAAGMAQALDDFEQCMAVTASLSRQIRSCEMDINMAETAAAMKLLVEQQSRSRAQGDDENGDGDDAESDEDESEEDNTHLPLMAKLQRLEMEHRAHIDEISELNEQLSELRATAGRVDPLKQQLSQYEERMAALTAAVDQLRADVSAARVAQRGAEELAEKRGAELKKLQQNAQGADMLRKYQDICLEAEERAVTAEKRAGLADARCAKAENSLKEVQSQVRALHKQLASNQADQQELMQKLASAEAALEAVRHEHEEKRSDGASKVQEQVKCLEEECASLHRELSSTKAALSALEQRLQVSEMREGRLMAELREAEAVSTQREELMAEVAALRDKVTEQRADRAQLEHYKQVAHELEETRARVEDELVLTGQLVTQLEARHRDALARVEAAETATQTAEARARHAESVVTAEVELRMAAACSNKSLWPHAIKEEFARVEQRLTSLQASLAAAQSQMESDAAMYKLEVKHKIEAQQHAAELDRRVLQLEQELAASTTRLEGQLDYYRKEVDTARETILRLETERDELIRKGTSGAGGLFRRTSSNLAGQVASPAKWQVQNRVGGGSLYGVADGAAPAAATNLSPSASLTSSDAADLLDHSARPSISGQNQASERPKVEGVDIVYLKNVILKFLEAAVTGKVQERDILLPAVATILQASPAEFKVLKKLFVNTTPPSLQMLSALGWK